MNITIASQGRRVLALDFARGVAILLAIGWHFHVETGYGVLDALQAPGATVGWAGVDLFFVLSGFLIGGLIFSEVKRTGRLDVRRFLIRRAFKIWPVLYCYILLLAVTGRYEPLQIVPQTLLHIQNFWQTPLSHLWSLAVEEHFYLAFALLILLFSLSGVSLNRLPALLVGVMVLALALRLIAAASGTHAQTLQVQTQFRADALACGVLLAYVKCFRPDIFAAMLQRKAVWLLAFTAGTAFLLLAPALVATVGYSVAFLTAAALLLLLLECGAWLEKNAVCRLVAWIGVYSYAMYVFQFVLYRASEKAWVVAGFGGVPPVVELVMKYVGAVVAAVLVTKAVERPSLALRNRLFPSRHASGGELVVRGSHAQDLERMPAHHAGRHPIYADRAAAAVGTAGAAVLAVDVGPAGGGRPDGAVDAGAQSTGQLQHSPRT